MGYLTRAVDAIHIKLTIASHCIHSWLLIFGDPWGNSVDWRNSGGRSIYTLLIHLLLRHDDMIKKEKEKEKEKELYCIKVYCNIGVIPAYTLEV